MRFYPDDLILDWMQFTGGTVNKGGDRGWGATNGVFRQGNLREAVGADITDARKNDRRCIGAFKRTTRGNLWLEYLSPLKP